MALDKTKRTLSSRKGLITRAINACKDAAKGPDTNVRELTLKVEALEQRWKPYQDAYYEYEEALVEADANDTDLGDAQRDFQATEETYISAVSEYRDILDSMPAQTSRSQTLKMPTLQTPTFNGDPLEFEPFWDQFQARVGQKKDVSDVDKLQFLKSCLKGSARDRIKNLPSTAANYKIAVDTLKSRYGDPEKVRVAIFEQIIEVKPPTMDKQSLEEFLNLMENLTKSLHTKHDFTSCEWMVAISFQRKLPKEVVNQLHLRYQRNYFTLAQLSEGLQDMICHMEIGTKFKPSNKQKSSNHHHSNGGSNPSSNPTTVGTYYGAASSPVPETEPEKHCRFCSGKHRDARCPQYSSVTTRKQRLKFLKLCETCLGNHSTQSCSTKLKNCLRCKQGIHHIALCEQLASPVVSANATTAAGKQSNKQSPPTSIPSLSKNAEPPDGVHYGVIAGASIAHASAGALPTALAELVHEEKSYTVRLFFDSGSQRTFITRTLVERHGLPIKQTQNLTLSGFMSAPATHNYPVARPLIKLGRKCKCIHAVVVDSLPQSIRTAGITETIRQLKEKGIPLADPHVDHDTVGAVDVLIGSDYYFDFISNHVIEREGMHLLKSPGGHLLTGKIPPRNLPKVDHELNPVISEHVVVWKVTDVINPLDPIDNHYDVDVPVHKLWDLDSIGIDPTKPAPDDSQTYQQYLDTVRYHEGQYWVKLPWKTNHAELPHNYRQAFGQMKSLVADLGKRGQHQSGHAYLDLYDEIIKEQAQAQFIEEVADAQPKKGTHYIPHHAVTKVSATTPLRVVFNCSAKAGPQVPSLNDCLLKGPTLTEKMGDVLTNFRTGDFAYTADISKAFLRVGLQEEDRDFTRFLWPKDPHNSQSPVVTYRFRSVLFGATSSPFLLQATLDYHLRTSASPLKEQIASSFYVDNFQGTTSDESHLIFTYQEANKELKLANMPLRQWTSNNPALRAIIHHDFPESDIPEVSPILGMNWTVNADQLSLKPVSYQMNNSQGQTKRSLLANVSKVFDPLGLFTPITIKGKLLVQEAWRLNASWDEQLPSHLSTQWETLAMEYEQLHTISLPRSVGNEGEPLSLHIFCDASKSAFGAVAYISSPQVTHLVTSKARVAPLKTRSLPQLELTALTIGTRLGVYLHKTLKHLNILNTVVWSDSEAALQWLKSDKCKITYVQNRVAEIREIQTHFKFLHVPTDANPADLLSRGMPFSKFTSCSLWFTGPGWLKDPSSWPEQKSFVVTDCVVHPICASSPSVAASQLPIDLRKFSSLGSLIRVTKLVFKFIKNISQRQLPDPLTYWIRTVQQEAYAPELNLMSTIDFNSSTKSSVLNKHRIVKDLGLYIDESGLIRCRGRLQHSPLRHSARHPILLPKLSWLTQLIVLEAHVTVLHGGVSETLTQVRQQFWIPQGRQMIKSTIKRCVTCIRYDGRPCHYPGPPPLPTERVQESKPFEVCGVDYTGSITVTNTADGIPAKAYICLFTCATTRAVHLEMATDLSADTFLQLFRRFAASRSCPRLVISDNGTNFRAANAFLKEYFNQVQVKQFFETRRCEWKFIPPRAPWQGGFYERLVGIVKRCLRKVLHNRKISLEELRTLLKEIEARVNNRPLTYVSEGLDEPEPLTPSHLLTGGRVEPVPVIQHNDLQVDPDFNPEPGGLTQAQLATKFSKLTKVLERWNKVWKEDYLTSLRERHYGDSKPTTDLPVKPGDVVIIESDTSRANWPLGKILSVHPDEHGTLRLVKVLSKGITSLRTIEKLIPLEVSSVESENPQVVHSQPEDNSRPVRMSALQARSRWQKFQDDGAL